jgi:hypothetical protein
MALITFHHFGLPMLDRLLERKTSWYSTEKRKSLNPAFLGVFISAAIFIIMLETARRGSGSYKIIACTICVAILRFALYAGIAEEIIDEDSEESANAKMKKSKVPLFLFLVAVAASIFFFVLLEKDIIMDKISWHSIEDAKRSYVLRKEENMIKSLKEKIMSF